MVMTNPSVSDPVKKGLNNLKLSDMYDLVGMKLTASDKCSTLTEFVDINDATFLKRSFKWSDFLNRTVAILDSNSIYKMSSVTVASSVASWPDQMISVANSALGEWFLYCSLDPDPRIRYDKIREIYLRALFVSFPDSDYSERIFTYAKSLSLYSKDAPLFL